MANCCGTLTGLSRGCDGSVGGIKRAWVACFGLVSDPTIVDGQITSVGTPVSEWKLYEFNRETGSADETINVGTNDNIQYSTDIVFVFTKQETAKRVEIAELAISDLRIIIEDNNNEYHYFGDSIPVTISAGDITTGTSFEDFNGYNLTFNSISRVPHYLLSEAAIDELNGVEE